VCETLVEVLSSLNLNTKHPAGAKADSVEDDGGDRQDISMGNPYRGNPDRVRSHEICARQYVTNQ
jgi:hypothetical protein